MNIAECGSRVTSPSWKFYFIIEKKKKFHNKTFAYFISIARKLKTFYYLNNYTTI